MAETPMATQAGAQVQSSVAPPIDGLSSTPTDPELGDGTEGLRGVIALPHKRAVLFTDEIELDVEALPRWRPHISVDERRLANEGHE